MLTTSRRIAMAALVVLAAAATVSCQDCDNIDPSTLDPSDVSAFATLLPCTGWDSTCQSSVLSAGTSCMQEFQAIQTWMNTSGETAELNATAGNATAGGNATEVTPEEAESELMAKLPDLKTALGGCCNGGITPTCCAAMAPIVSGKCLCQEKPIELLKGVMGQDPAQFMGVASKILGELGCNALDGAQVYPECQA